MGGYSGLNLRALSFALNGDQSAYSSHSQNPAPNSVITKSRTTMCCIHAQLYVVAADNTS